MRLEVSCKMPGGNHLIYRNRKEAAFICCFGVSLPVGEAVYTEIQ